MKTFEFTIIASGLDHRASDFERRIHDSGCSDATPSFQKGHIILEFARDSDSVDQAVASAISDVRAAGATVERVEPDPLVSLSEIAARSGLTRSALTQYAKGQRGRGFPAPVAKITSESPLWDWATVTLWLYRRKKVSRAIAIQAAAVGGANDAILRKDPDIARTIGNWVSEYETMLRDPHFAPA